MKKKVLLVLLVVALLVAPMSFAGDSNGYNDVSESDWFYDAVNKLSDYGVIGGYGDGTFRPYGNVKRSEYSKLMVAGLGLELDTSIPSIFVDVDDSYWAKPYIMTAKNYLTAYNSYDGVQFRPEYYAEREDITVALVKALGYGDDDYEDATLDRFEDESLISDNLRKYVAIAVEKELIGGSETDGKLYFKPRSEITRAETAQLLSNVIESEKIVFDDVKVVLDDDTLAPVVTGYTKDDGSVQLNWTKSNLSGFDYYKVVYSTTNKSPAYPDDKYVYAISNIDDLDATVDSLAAGYYYFSVTTVADGKYYPGNAVALEVKADENSDTVPPLVTGYTKDDGSVQLNWTKSNISGFDYYKVVYSTTNKTPAYPGDNHIYAISNINDLDATITTLPSGTYYFSVTTVANGKYYAGNALPLEVINEDDDSSSDVDYVSPQLTITTDLVNDELNLSWTEINHPKFNGYKIVISVDNSAPIYPTDGYLTYITNKDTTTYTVRDEMSYKNSSLTTLEDGQSYYFSITALYSDKKVAGNSVYVEVP